MTEEPAPHLCLAIDIGGTKIAVGLVDRSGQVLWQDRTRTPKATDPDALFRVVADLIEDRDAGSRCRGGCSQRPVSAAEARSPASSVSPVNIRSWRRFPLADRVRSLPRLEKLGIPVALDNDAKALALAEGWRGNARGEANFLAMVVSTGVGGGLVLDGRLLDGAEGNAGHIGHMMVEPDGRLCGCGARGCLEAEASGTAIEAITGQPAAQAPPDVRERAGRLVGRAVASVANLLDLRRVLVGGSVALGYGVTFFLAAQREIDERARLEFSAGTRIDPVGLGTDAPLVGAAAVGWRALGQDVLGRAE